MARMTGAWARRTAVGPLVPVQAATDPQHMTPDANPEFVNQTPSWVQGTPMPGLPGDLLMENAYPHPVIAPGGPQDQTPWGGFEGHSFGPGAGPGITQAEASAIRGYWGELDMGAIAMHDDVPVVETEDMYGRYVQDDMTDHGDSPATLQYEQQGYGSPLDPDARLGKREKRFSQRYIDMHRYEVHPTPYTPQYAVPVPAQGIIANGNQHTSPFANNMSGQIGTVDTFVQEQIRRAPAEFGAAYSQDGTPSNLFGSVNAYGLPSWGL